MKIKYSNHEILVLPDYYSNSETVDELVRIIPTGPIKPMMKRLIASFISKGTFCAFIDSDAFPTKDWLKNAIRHFEDPKVAVVVGPSLTPNEDGLLAKASGFVLASPFGGGSESLRYNSSSRMRYVSEAPACNFIIRKSILKAVKESVRDIWPGEEIVLCGVVTRDLKKKIVYDPQVTVYHHRRPLFVPHLKQVWSYGLVKGFLLRSYHRYIRLRFLAPSFLVLGLIIGLLLAIVHPMIRYTYIFLVSCYILLSLLNGVVIGVQQKNLKMVLLTFVGFITTHICYGLAFIKGMFSRKM